MKSANIVHLIPQNLCYEALRTGRTLYLNAQDNLNSSKYGMDERERERAKNW